MSTKQESVSEAAFKTWLLSSDFNFPGKDDWVTAATSKYCPLVVSPTVTNCCKEVNFKYGKITRSVFENLAMHKNYSGFVWKPDVFLYFWNVATFIECNCFFCATFYSMIKYFWLAF